MKFRIWKYSISIATVHLLRLSSVLLLLCIGLPSIAQQQQQRPAPVQKRDQKKKEVVVDTIPFYNGTYVGVDYNTMAKKKEKNSYLYVGLRYAFSSFKYDVSTMPVDDPIWGGSIPFSHLGMKGSMQWFELVVGVKVRIYKNFNMGWSVRMKYKTNASTNEYANPWYVPGYGKFKSNNMGITYSLIYKLPL